MTTSKEPQQARDAIGETSGDTHEVDGIVSDALDKGRQAAQAMRDVSDNFVDAIDESIQNRPYATLALVAAVGFVVGAAWRR
jgi:ElaB/YqjD/DUF883 family membrane-anchored ribosome-binding protein